MAAQVEIWLDLPQANCLFRSISRNPQGILANVFDFSLVVGEFELQSCCYIHFRRSDLWIDNYSLISPPLSSGLNSTTTVLLQRWLWIRQSVWYAIKQRYQNKLITLVSNIFVVFFSFRLQWFVFLFLQVYISFFFSFYLFTFFITFSSSLSSSSLFLLSPSLYSSLFFFTFFTFFFTVI